MAAIDSMSDAKQCRWKKSIKRTLDLLEKYEEAVKDLELANNMEQGSRDVKEVQCPGKSKWKYYKKILLLEVSKDANDDEIKKA